MKYPDDFINQIICGDCEEVLKDFPDNYIDTIITDPPYGLKFMGKKWDSFRNSRVAKSQVVKNLGTGMRQTTLQENINFMEWTSMWAKEALRILKPGGTMLCFAGSRTQHLVAFGIELAGWILKDCIMWIYGSGFPKATDISKQIDKRAGEERKCLKEKIKIGKDLFNEESEREIIRKNEFKASSIFGSEIYNNRKEDKIIDITAPATPKAILWNGWKSHGLKPAYEPILVAMKPNEGSYANNALKYGVAGLNIDGGRIGFKDKADEYHRDNKTASKGIFFKEQEDYKLNRNSDNKGRYPANVILDEEAGRLLDEMSGNCKSGAMKKPYKYTNNGYSLGKPTGETKQIHEASQGGASRFFYCAKASKAERNRGCEGLEKRYSDDTRKDKDAIGCNNPRNRSGIPEKNYHPTVKPLALMKYLCTLTNTPTGGIVLDPFCGSGTTLMACKELKRDYIGIDNNAEYCEIARNRTKAIPDLLF